MQPSTKKLLRRVFYVFAAVISIYIYMFFGFITVPFIVVGWAIFLKESIFGTIGFTILSAAVAFIGWFFNGLGTLDCGDSCSQEVNNSNLATKIVVLCIIFVLIIMMYWDVNRTSKKKIKKGIGSSSNL